MLSDRRLPFLLLATLFLIPNSSAFQCYVCDSKNDMECVEKLPEDTRLQPQSCQNITDAKYCIKTTNVYAGELGTKRFCAANDHGNYCRYIRQPTGDREYRSCVLTCSSENCNGAESRITAASIVLIIGIISTVSLFTYLRAWSNTRAITLKH